MSEDFEVDKKLAMLAELSDLLQLARTRAEAAAESVAFSQADVHKISPPAPGGSDPAGTSLPFKCRLAFVVSDHDWRDVLQLVPVANWTNADGSTTTFPLLICQTEYVNDGLKPGPEDAYGCFDVLRGYLLNAGSALDVVYNAKGDTAVALVDGKEFLQPFVPTEPVLSKIEVQVRADVPFPLRAMPSSTTVSISVRAQASSKPLSSIQFLASTLSAQSSWHTVVLPTPLFLHPGETYYVAVSVTTPGPGQKTSVFWAAQPLTGPSRGPERLLGARALVRGALKTYYPQSYVYVVGQFSISFWKRMSWLLYQKLKLSADCLCSIPKFDASVFWSAYSECVICETDDYASSLIGSVFAADLHAPLCIMDAGSVMLGTPVLSACKMVHAIGAGSEMNQGLEKTLAKSNLEIYTIWDAQKAYVARTGTSKICLTNPEDIFLFYDCELCDEVIEKDRVLLGEPSTVIGVCRQLYRGMSLGSALLAASRRELLIFSEWDSVEQVSSWLQLHILALSKECHLTSGHFKYLTIVGSPGAVPMTVLVENLLGSGMNGYVSADGTSYSRVTGDGWKPLACGRIYAITVTDISAYIARSVVLNSGTINCGPVASIIRELVAGEKRADESEAWVALSELLREAGTDVWVEELPYETGVKAGFIAHRGIVCYDGHGNTGEAGIKFSDLPNLSGAFFVATACDALAFDRLNQQDPGGPDQLFGPNVLRRGALGFYGAVDSTGGYVSADRVAWSLLGRGTTTGEATEWCRTACWFFGSVVKESSYQLADQYCLLGDPCIALTSPPSLPVPYVFQIDEWAWGVSCMVKNGSKDWVRSLAACCCTGGGFFLELELRPAQQAIELSRLSVICSEFTKTYELGPRNYLFFQTDGRPMLRILTSSSLPSAAFAPGSWEALVLLVTLE